MAVAFKGMYRVEDLKGAVLNRNDSNGQAPRMKDIKNAFGQAIRSLKEAGQAMAQVFQAKGQRSKPKNQN